MERLPAGFGHSAALALGGELVTKINRAKDSAALPDESGLSVVGIELFITPEAEPIVVLKQAARLGHPLGDDDLICLPLSAREAFGEWRSQFEESQRQAKRSIEY